MKLAPTPRNNDTENSQAPTNTAQCLIRALEERMRSPNPKSRMCFKPKRVASYTTSTVNLPGPSPICEASIPDTRSVCPKPFLHQDLCNRLNVWAYTLNHKTLMALQVLRSIGLLEVTPAQEWSRSKTVINLAERLRFQGRTQTGCNAALFALSPSGCPSLFPCLSVSPI